MANADFLLSYGDSAESRRPLLPQDPCLPPSQVKGLLCIHRATSGLKATNHNGCWRTEDSKRKRILPGVSGVVPPIVCFQDQSHPHHPCMARRPMQGLLCLASQIGRQARSGAIDGSFWIRESCALLSPTNILRSTELLEPTLVHRRDSSSMVLLLAPCRPWYAAQLTAGSTLPWDGRELVLVDISLPFILSLGTDLIVRHPTLGLLCFVRQEQLWDAAS